MARFEQDFVDGVNQPGRMGVLATADAEGHPDVAYFGSPRLDPEGSLVMGLSNNRSLANLEANPHAVFLAVEKSPVVFNTPGWRLYLRVIDIQREGPVLDAVRQAIEAQTGPEAANMIKAGVVFEVGEVRPLVDMG